MSRRRPRIGPDGAGSAPVSEVREMVIVECPWCGEGAGVEMMPEPAVLRCEACDVSVEIADDDARGMAAAA
jgi:uncharacterized protein (DUF983 family)